jgi:hypothetical protein
MTTRMRQPWRARLASRLVAACCAVLITTSLHAAPVKEQDLIAAVETWVRHVTADGRPDAVIERLEPHVVSGQTAAYVAHLGDGGYCLCGSDNLVLPVYLYCPQGAYDPGNPSNQYILWEIGTRLTGLRAARAAQDPRLKPHEPALAERADFWKGLIDRQPPADKRGMGGRADPDSMVLPLTCTWSQGWPYKGQCPELPPGSGDHTIVGCVATAMTQIMYYWQWPPLGENSHSHDYNYRWRSDWDSEPCANDPGIPGGYAGRLQWTSANGGQLQMNGYWDHSIYSAARKISEDGEYRAALETLYNHLTPETTNCYANFGATTYDWSLIQDIHEDPPDPGDIEVAKLCYHGGIAVSMGWGVWASTASTSAVANALEGYFHYDPDTAWASRSVATMTDEIQWFRPVELRGTDPDAGGHAWVVYGYDKSTDPDRLFLMNMGWGGDGNGWYSCDNVNPLSYEFNIDQAHVTGIAPESVVRFADYGIGGGDGSPDNPYQGISYALSFAPDETTLILKAGSIHTLSGDPVVIDKPITFKGYQVTIARQ